MLIRIGHSPDPDDAFMFYALTAGKVKAEGIEVEHVLEDIESLNRRARTGEIEVTADKIPKAVLEGQADLGLLIHEGQITHQQMGLLKVLDMGQEWERETGLPLPLGINVMRRDLGEDVHRKLSQALRDSIDYAYAHVDEAIEYAMRYGRGIDKDTCRRFVLMYVNDYTKRLGDDGRAALTRLYRMAHAKGLIPELPPVDPI